jgi:hypothetical protein
MFIRSMLLMSILLESIADNGVACRIRCSTSELLVKGTAHGGRFLLSPLPNTELNLSDILSSQQDGHLALWRHDHDFLFLLRSDG